MTRPILISLLALTLPLLPACDQQAKAPLRINADDQPRAAAPNNDQLNTLLQDIAIVINASAPANNSPAAARFINLGRFINQTPAPAKSFATFRDQTQRQLQALAPNHDLILGQPDSSITHTAYRLHATVLPVDDTTWLINWTLTGPTATQFHAQLWTAHTTAPAPNPNTFAP